jgi:hypothetical protein
MDIVYMDILLSMDFVMQLQIPEYEFQYFFRY